VEAPKNRHRVRDIPPSCRTDLLIKPHRRSQSSAGHKTKWQVRMEKTKREHAVKKLEVELKQEKKTEKQR
jgi:hypothetical protein